ncbi:MAG TPA: polysaccharide biosynthesis/export family protein, partial [Bryobacteraceae bacterium]|nr:polysaccharide biosynthesis/export family protein [Bryobacteraceae bacterium]
PASTVPAQETAPVRSTPPVAVPPAEAATPDANALKPGCDVEKPPAPDATPAKPYVIGSLDVLDVRVWNNQNLSGIVDVGPDGMISLPLIGQLKADVASAAGGFSTSHPGLSAFASGAPPPAGGTATGGVVRAGAVSCAGTVDAGGTF